MKKTTIFLLALSSYFSSFSQNELMEKGDKQAELNNFPAAIQTYNKALKAKPDNADILSKLADANFKLGNMAEAENFYSKASAISNADPLTNLKYGKLLMRNGKYAEAKKAFEKYAKTNSIEAKHFIESCDFATESFNQPAIYQVQNANLINSQFDEFGSTLIGGKLIYSSGRMDMQRKTSKMPVGSNQLFISDLEKGKPVSKSFFRPDLKSSYNDGPIAVDASLKFAAITHNNIMNGIAAMQQNGLELSLAIAELNKNGEWTSAKPFSQNIVGYSTGFACLSADGNTIYFSSDRPGGQGGFDLYSAQKTAEGWSKPTNLGDVINTSGNEISPYLDGENLFFSSDFHQGFGGYDIFRAEKNGKEFKTIYHLGNEVNTGADDYCFIYDSKSNVGFLTSNRAGSKGGTDIFTVSKQANQIVINVKNAENQPIENAKIDFSKCGESAFTTKANGTYSFQTLSNFSCDAVVSKEGYTSSNFNVSAQKGAYDVVLSKELPTFVGIVNDSKGQAVEGVLVRATNQTTKETVEAISNDKGEYSLPLVEKSNYNLSFSKSGFINLQSIAKVEINPKKDFLSKKVLLSVGEALPIESSVANVTMNRKGAAPTVLSSESKSGFAVQIASVSGDKADLKVYDKLKSFGNIYSSVINNTSKIKIGTFQTREEAVKALSKVKEQGFLQAFIVEEGKVATLPKAVEKVEVVEKKVTGVPNPKLPKRMERDAIATPYKVRIATLTDATKFDPKNLERIATVDKMKSGDKTIILLTNFNSLEEARNARDQAIQMGYKDAHVVEPKSGVLTKIE